MADKVNQELKEYVQLCQEAGKAAERLNSLLDQISEIEKNCIDMGKLSDSEQKDLWGASACLGSLMDRLQITAPVSLRSLESKKQIVKRLANNALYLEDRLDYGSALWQILHTVAPEMFREEEEPKLELIDIEEGES